MAEWTSERVKDELVEAFRRVPEAPIFAARRSDLIDSLGGDRIPHYRFLAATFWVLGQDATPHDRQRRLMLLTWARVTSQQQDGARETSMRQICREMGWDWSVFQRTHKEAAQEMAHMMDMADKLVSCVLKFHP